MAFNLEPEPVKESVKKPYSKIIYCVLLLVCQPIQAQRHSVAIFA